MIYGTGRATAGAPESFVFGRPVEPKEEAGLVLGRLAAIIERVEREGSSFIAPVAGGAAAPGHGAYGLDASGLTPRLSHYTIRAE